MNYEYVVGMDTTSATEAFRGVSSKTISDRPCGTAILPQCRRLPPKEKYDDFFGE